MYICDNALFVSTAFWLKKKTVVFRFVSFVSNCSIFSLSLSLSLSQHLSFLLPPPTLPVTHAKDGRITERKYPEQQQHHIQHSSWKTQTASIGKDTHVHTHTCNTSTRNILTHTHTTKKKKLFEWNDFAAV